MADEKTMPEAEPRPVPEQSEDEKMTAAGFRKVRGRWVR